MPTAAVDPSITQRVSSLDWVGPRLVLRAHRAGYGFATVTWAEFAARVELDRPDAVTVDVFDTCVTRTLAGDQPIETVAATWAQHPDDGGQPIGYDTAAARLEMALCRPVPGAVDALERVRAVVGQIVFISDTDRSSELLIDLLRSHGLFATGDRLLASCEHHVTKSDGGLYKRVWPNRPETVWHLGNNNWADGSMAAASGYEPFDIPHANPSRYEAALCADPNGLGPVLASAARSARLAFELNVEQGKIDEKTFALNRIGAQVAGPLMAAFALWLGDQVRGHGFDHLGFLARDGELPLLVAERVPDRDLRAVPKSYVHLNRLTINLAMAPVMGVDAWVREGSHDRFGFLRSRLELIALGGLLQRIGFDHHDVANTAGPSSPLLGLNPREPIPPGLEDEWLVLLDNPSVRELIADRAVERRRVVVDYLDQFGLLSSAKPAFVDVGWSGRIARSINIALGEEFASEPVHLHVGGDEVPPEIDQQVEIHRFAFPGASKIAPFDKPGGVVETLTASGNPRVIGHRRAASGRVEPVFEDHPIEVGQADRSELWRGALAMAEQLPPVEQIASWGLTRRPLDRETLEVLRLWWYEPDSFEAEAMANFSFEGDEAGAQVCPLLAPYQLSDIAEGSRVRRQWREGSQAISSLPTRVGLRAALLGRRLIKRGDA